MIFSIIKHLFVEEAGGWIRKVPTWCLYATVGATAITAFLLPDVVPGLEEGISAIIFVKIAHELVRRRGGDPKKIDEKH